MDWKHCQTVDHPKWEPQVGRGLFGIRLLILHYKFQFSKSIKSSMFRIFLNVTYSLRKNISFPKCPKITQKFTGAAFKIWWCLWNKINFLILVIQDYKTGNTKYKTVDHLSKTFWNDLANFSLDEWNLRKVHSGISFLLLGKGHSNGCLP